jgi:hypothetical protein
MASTEANFNFQPALKIETYELWTQESYWYTLFEGVFIFNVLFYMHTFMLLIFLKIMINFTSSKMQKC